MTPRPLKILHVITGLGAGGAERQLATLILNADPARVRHEVVSLIDEGVWGAPLRARGVTVHALGMGNPFTDALAFWRLARLMRRVRADLVQTWLYHADFAGLVAAKLAGAPRPIWTVRCSDMRLEHYSRRTRLLLRLLARLSHAPAAVVANSASGWAWHAALGYRPPRHQVIPNGIDTAAFRPDPEARDSVRAELGIPAGAPLVGNLSRHDPMKDHPTFLQAVAESHTDAWALLAGIGTGPGNPALDRQIAVAGLAPERILRLGERRDVPRLMAALDVAVLSSSFGEGFPNIVAEAMACGIPSLATRVGDTAEVIGDCGRVVAPDDPAVLAHGIAELLALSAEARMALGERARARIESRFSVPAMVAAYERLYGELVGAQVG
jgi:glycosyltransferase involved in cell wall biosynthesis